MDQDNNITPVKIEVVNKRSKHELYRQLKGKKVGYTPKERIGSLKKFDNSFKNLIPKNDLPYKEKGKNKDLGLRYNSSLSKFKKIEVAPVILDDVSSKIIY